jgi:hypothetical protein
MKEHNKAREKRYLAKVKTGTEMKMKVMVLSEECSSFPRSFQSLLTLLLCFYFVMGSPLSLGFFIIFFAPLFSPPFLHPSVSYPPSFSTVFLPVFCFFFSLFFLANRWPFIGAEPTGCSPVCLFFS